MFAEGTSYVYRDWLMRAALGEAIEIEMADGTVLPTRREMSDNPQYMLDQISNVPGSWLVRSPGGWIGTPPPMGTPLVTAIARTTDETPASHTTHLCTFETALVDQLGLWDPANPTRLGLPTNAQLLRISFNIYSSGWGATRRALGRLKPATSDYRLPGYPSQMTVTTSTINTGAHLSAIGAWHAPLGDDYTELDLLLGTATTYGFNYGTTLQVEAVF